MNNRPNHDATDVMLDEYSFLKDWGYTVEQIAARLHIQPASLRRTLMRAADRGDPRSDFPARPVTGKRPVKERAA